MINPLRKVTFTLRWLFQGLRVVRDMVKLYRLNIAISPKVNTI